MDSAGCWVSRVNKTLLHVPVTSKMSFDMFKHKQGILKSSHPGLYVDMRNLYVLQILLSRMSL